MPVKRNREGAEWWTALTAAEQEQWQHFDVLYENARREAHRWERAKNRIRQRGRLRAIRRQDAA